MIPISVCIITKNEAENLEKCLASLKPYPFEIVVVDTGSSDNSKEVAYKYTDKVYDFEWINDFSAARNFAASKASHNMIFPMDTDESIKELDWDALQSLADQNPKGIGMVKRLDYFEVDGDLRFQEAMIERLYNRKFFRFERVVHEALFPIGNVKLAYYDLPVVIDHTGYIGAKEKLDEKAMRDLKLLLEILEKNPNNPYDYFQVAQCYMLMRDHDNAYEYFKKAMEHHPNLQDTYTRILINNYGNILVDRGEMDEAMSLLSYYDYYENNADYLCMIGLVYLHIGQPLKALPEFVKALTAPEHDSVQPKVLSYYIGFIYELFEQKEIALSHYQKCQDYTPALEAIKRLNS